MLHVSAKVDPWFYCNGELVAIRQLHLRRCNVEFPRKGVCQVHRNARKMTGELISHRRLHSLTNKLHGISRKRLVALRYMTALDVQCGGEL